MRNIFISLVISMSLSLGLVSCSLNSSTYAPVTEISRTDPLPPSGVHRVTLGETLYSIAWRYGLDYQDLAEMNQIKAPYTVHLGEKLYLKKAKPSLPKQQAKPTKVAKQKPKPAKAVYKDQVKEPGFNVRRWSWPLRGKIVRTYSWKNKGIDIATRPGQQVRATAPGKVVYSGNGLKSYGNLIIIKHNSRYLSAYAYNRSVKVHEGQWVKRGQVIALSGYDSQRRSRLHFEIRRNGRATNPLKLLK